MSAVERIAGPPAVVDEAAVTRELEGFVVGWHAAAPESPRWQITDMGAADWAMRKLALFKSRVAEYERESARWLDAASTAARAVTFFEERLQEWALRSRSDDRKTFNLASGKVSTRAGEETIAVVDEPAVIAWAEADGPAASAVETVKRFHVRQVPSGRWRIADLLEGWEVIDRSSGERTGSLRCSSREGWPPSALLAIDAREGMVCEIAADSMVTEVMRQGLAVVWPAEEGWEVRPLTRRAVVDGDGYEVPGVSVRPGKVTASVRPTVGELT